MCCGLGEADARACRRLLLRGGARGRRGADASPGADAPAAAAVALRATFVAAGGYVYVGLAPLEPGDS